MLKRRYGKEYSKVEAIEIGERPLNIYRTLLKVDQRNKR